MVWLAPKFTLDYSLNHYFFCQLNIKQCKKERGNVTVTFERSDNRFSTLSKTSKSIKLADGLLQRNSILIHKEFKEKVKLGNLITSLKPGSSDRYKCSILISFMHPKPVPSYIFPLPLLRTSNTMASSLSSLSFLFAILLLMQAQAYASTCNDCFIQSRAAYYPNSDELGTDSKIMREKYIMMLYFLSVHVY